MAKAPHIPIIDEWKVIRTWLRDETWNMGLSDIIPSLATALPGGDEADRDSYITRERHEGDHTDLPTIDIVFLGDSGSQTAEPLDVDYDTQVTYQTDRYEMRIRLDIQIGTDQVLMYDGVPWRETPTTLNVIRKVIQATFGKPDGYAVTVGDAALCIRDARRTGSIIREDVFPNIDELRLYYNFTVEERRPYVALGP